MKIVSGFAAVCNIIAVCFAIWWAYVTANANDQHKIAAFILAAAVLVGSVLYLITFAYLVKQAHRAPHREQLGDSQTDRVNAFRDPKWKIISKHTFENDSIEVDGKSFRDCKFTNVTFVFSGSAPTEFTGRSEFEGKIRLSTSDAPTLFWRALEQKFATIPGAEIETFGEDARGNRLDLRVTAIPAEPLSKRIFDFCKELTTYLKDRQARPDEDALWNETRGEKEQWVQRYQNEIGKWDNKLAAGYYLRFRQKAIDLVNELELADQHDDQLEAAVRELELEPTGHYPKAMQAAIERFRILASKLE